MNTSLPRSLSMKQPEITRYRRELKKSLEVIEKAKTQRVNYRDYVGSMALRQAKEDASFLRTAITRHEKAVSGNLPDQRRSPDLNQVVKIIKKLSQSMRSKDIAVIAGCSEQDISNLLHNRNKEISVYLQEKIRRYTTRLLKYHNNN